MFPTATSTASCASEPKRRPLRLEAPVAAEDMRDRSDRAARLLDGVAVAAQIRAEVAPAVSEFTAKAGRPPGLGIVLVGNDPASEVYVASKLKSAGEAGLRADLERLPATASLAELLSVVAGSNRSDVHNGILVQSPLPDAMGPDAERQVFDA